MGRVNTKDKLEVKDLSGSSLAQFTYSKQEEAEDQRGEVIHSESPTGCLSKWGRLCRVSPERGKYIKSAGLKCLSSNSIINAKQSSEETLE